MINLLPMLLVFAIVLSPALLPAFISLGHSVRSTITKRQQLAADA